MLESGRKAVLGQMDRLFGVPDMTADKPIYRLPMTTHDLRKGGLAPAER